jgi:hypothetical protein
LEPSSSSGTWVDRLALAGLGLGLAGYVMPFWAEGRLRWAFWVTLASTALHLLTSRLAARPRGDG